MTNAVKSVLETGRSAVESGASTLSDLVDEARSRIEDLPPLAHARRKRSRKNWSTVVTVVLLALLVTMVVKRRGQQSSHQHADQAKP